jgi:hypothetical protein
MGFGKFLARVLFQELGVSVPSSVFHVLFITRLYMLLGSRGGLLADVEFCPDALAATH